MADSGRVDLSDDSASFPASPQPSQVLQLSLLLSSDAAGSMRSQTIIKSWTTSLPDPQISRSRVTLQDCLQRFSVREQLGESDKWYCSACKAHVRAFKTMGIWRLPAVLIIHLKRFKKGAAWSGGGRKVDDPVLFPITGLDMAPFIIPGAAAAVAAAGGDGGTLYDLYAISQHSGGTSGGHYTAVCLNARDGRWYDFNDSSTSPTTPVPDDRSA